MAIIINLAVDGDGLAALTFPGCSVYHGFAPVLELGLNVGRPRGAECCLDVIRCLVD